MKNRMIKRTLSDAQTQKSIERFIFEARECARQEFGFAAMSAIFSVILAVSEAVNPNSYRDEDLLKAFVPQMADKSSWLVAPVTNLSDDDVAEKLVQVRNSLVHQLSLPPDIYLTNTSADAREASKEYPNKYFISTVEFVDVIARTVRHIIEVHPNAVFDPCPRTQRDIANRLERLVSAKTPSISGVDFESVSGNEIQIQSPAEE